MFVVFFLVWIVLNERLTAETAVFGLVIAAALQLFVCKFIHTDRADRRGIVSSACFFVKYAAVLVVEILKANAATLRRIFSRRQPEPVLVSFTVPLKEETDCVLLANAITLTPGTITVEQQEGRFTVHCLDRSMAQGLEDSVFVRLLMKREGLQ